VGFKSAVSVAISTEGQLLASVEELIELMLCDTDLTNVVVDDAERISRYNDHCKKFDKQEFNFSPHQTPLNIHKFHNERITEWLNEYADDSIWEELFAKCKTPQEQTRFVEELEEFSRRGMLPLLQNLYSIIQSIDEKGIVRGVGRGSSVASFILYLMEVHFVNPLEYNLPLSDFLR
jgi:DNA polymerase III alpha subunit